MKRDRKVERPAFMPPSSSARSPMPQKTIEMTFSFRSHSIVEMMPFILVPSIWDLQQVNQQESFSILDLSIWPSLVCFVTMRLLATTSSKSTIHCPEASCRGTKLTRDVRQWLTTCINQNQTKFCQRHHPSLPMDPLSYKVSYGRIILASSH